MWHTVSITVNNRSNFEFKPSETFPCLLQNGSINSDPLSLVAPGPENEKLEPIREARQSRLAEFERTGDGGAASCLLSFEYGQESKTLAIWIWMLPEQPYVCIKIGLRGKDGPIDNGMLAKLSSKLTAAEEFGFDTHLQWDITEGEENHSLWIECAVQAGLVTDEDLDTYNEKGPRVSITITDPIYVTKLAEAASKDRHRVPNYQIASGPGQLTHKPVHENVTLAALIAESIISPTTTYRSVIGSSHDISVPKPDIWEFLRGVIWNDDPLCYLFNDVARNAGDFTIGGHWAFSYEKANAIARLNEKAKLGLNPVQKVLLKSLGADSGLDLIGRSHFGDLQFLHAMASEAGEAAQTTKDSIMLYLEVMYKLSIGQEISGQTQVKNSKLQKIFPSGSPTGEQTFHQLLTGGQNQYSGVKLDRRAIGSCFHIIQDSYAVGHCKRIVKNPGKMRPRSNQNPIYAFEFGSPGRFGAIVKFHCYAGQNADAHDAYDKCSGMMVPADLRSFDSLLGGRDAILACSRLAKYWNLKKGWEGEVQKFLADEVFELVPNPGPSDNLVDL